MDYRLKTEIKEEVNKNFNRILGPIPWSMKEIVEELEEYTVSEIAKRLEKDKEDLASHLWYFLRRAGWNKKRFESIRREILDISLMYE